MYNLLLVKFATSNKEQPMLALDKQGSDLLTLSGPSRKIGGQIHLDYEKYLGQVHFK